MDHLGVGIDNHIVVGGKRTSSLRLRHLAHRSIGLFEPNLDETHATHANRFEPGMVAKNRDLEPEALDRFNNQFAFGNLKLHIVDRKGNEFWVRNGRHSQVHSNESALALFVPESGGLRHIYQGTFPGHIARV